MAEPDAFTGYRFAQATVEVRYEKAHRYWDDCGKVISALEARLNGLVCVRLGQNGFEFTGPVSLGITSASFFWDRTSITCTDPGAQGIQKRFAESASEFHRLVAYGLGIQRVTRVGNRLWHYMPFPTIAEAVEFLRRQKLWNPEGELKTWGKQSNEALRVQFSLDDDRSVVLRVGSGTMTKEKQVFGVFVDTDFFTTRDSTPAEQVDLEGFIKTNTRFLEQRISFLLIGTK